jgi:hypothetical protein
MANLKAAVVVPIGLEVLNSLVTNKTMLNASTLELEDQTFDLHSMVVGPSSKQPTNKDLSKLSDNTPLIKARYVNSVTKKAFLIPIRGLLSLKRADLPSPNDKYEKDVTPVSDLADVLMESATEKVPAALPPTFRVVSVENKIHAPTGEVMYPPYCYEMFSDEIKRLQTLAKEDTGSAENIDILSIYQNSEFMANMYKSPRADRFKSVEPNKVIVISF